MSPSATASHRWLPLLIGGLFAAAPLHDAHAQTPTRAATPLCVGGIVVTLLQYGQFSAAPLFVEGMRLRNDLSIAAARDSSSARRLGGARLAPLFMPPAAPQSATRPPSATPPTGRAVLQKYLLAPIRSPQQLPGDTQQPRMWGCLIADRER